MEEDIILEDDIVLGKTQSKTSKMYLLVYNGWEQSDCKDMLDAFLKEKTISFWRTDIYNSFYIVSKEHIDTIRDKIHNYIESLRFVLVEMKNVSGWLPTDGWKAINKYTKTNNCAKIVDEPSNETSAEIEI